MQAAPSVRTAGVPPEPDPLPPWVIRHVPHASRSVPADVLSGLSLPVGELRREMDRLTDHRADALLVPRSLEGPLALAAVSRFVVDVTRAERDEDEPWAERGLGVIYLRDSQGRTLRRAPQRAEREAWLRRWYRPHHARLAELVRTTLARHGRALLLELHAFPATPMPFDRDATAPRADVSLTGDPHHTPPALLADLCDAFRDGRFRVAIDAPYPGMVVPAPFRGAEPRLAAVKVSVNRRLYQDPTAWHLLEGASLVAATLRRCLHQGVMRWVRTVRPAN